MGGSLFFVVLYLCLHTQSLFLALSGMFTITLSFPLAYGVYCSILGAHRMIAINFLSLFVVIGVGADDVFVLTDTWNQLRSEAWRRASRLRRRSGAEEDENFLEPDSELLGLCLAQQMQMTYRRAGAAIFATSAT